MFEPSGDVLLTRPTEAGFYGLILDRIVDSNCFPTERHIIIKIIIQG
jgi:hypothetical protein